MFKVTSVKKHIDEYLAKEVCPTFSGLLRHLGFGSEALRELRESVAEGNANAIKILAKLDDVKLMLEDRLEKNLIYQADKDKDLKLLFGVWVESKKRGVYDYIGSNANIGYALGGRMRVVEAKPVLGENKSELRLNDVKNSSQSD